MNRKIRLITSIPIFLCVVAIIIGATLLFISQNVSRITTQNQEYFEDSISQQAGNVEATINDGYDNIKIIIQIKKMQPYLVKLYY